MLRRDPIVDFDSTHEVLAALEREGVRYAIFGAVALSLHGLARATEDLGIFVAPERGHVDRLRRALHAVFDDPHIDDIDTDELLNHLPGGPVHPAGGRLPHRHPDPAGRSLGVRRPRARARRLSRNRSHGGLATYALRDEEGNRPSQALGRCRSAPQTLRPGGMMPIRRFRSVDEMGDNTWHRPGDPELFQAIRATWSLAARQIRPRFPPGVYKHRSIEDAERQREAWAKANFERYQQRQRSAGAKR